MGFAKGCMVDLRSFIEIFQPARLKQAKWGSLVSNCLDLNLIPDGTIKPSSGMDWGKGF
jgi:hypothetical protein